jgi:hypothetical protein
LETALIVEPLVGQDFTTIHATHRNDHRTTLSGESIRPHLFVDAVLSRQPSPGPG